MLLQHSTWREVEHYLEHSRALIVPIGSTEQHGPIGLIGTDAICAEVIAHGMGERSGGLVGPAIALGSAQFNLAFPGTVSLRASTLMAVVTDYVQSLARQGFERFYFLNGHGGNIGPARAAFQDLYATYSLQGRECPLRCRLRSWWEYPEVDRLRKAWYGAGEGLHGTPSEIAIVQYALDVARTRARETGSLSAPEHLSAEFLRDHGGDNHWDAQSHRTAFPDGRVGSDSGLATAEQGRALFDAAVIDAAIDYHAFLAEH